MTGKALHGLAERWAQLVPGQDVSTVEPVARLGSLARLLERFHRETLRPFGLELSDYQVLAALWTAAADEDFSPGQLCQFLRQTPAGMTKTLDRLESRRAIRRVPSRLDRRSFIIELSASGRRLAERVCLAELDAQQELFSNFRRRDLEQFDTFLESLTRALTPGELQ